MPFDRCHIFINEMKFTQKRNVLYKRRARAPVAQPTRAGRTGSLDYKSRMRISHHAYHDKITRRRLTLQSVWAPLASLAPFPPWKIRREAYP